MMGIILVIHLDFITRVRSLGLWKLCHGCIQYLTVTKIIAVNIFLQSFAFTEFKERRKISLIDSFVCSKVFEGGGGGDGELMQRGSSENCWTLPEIQVQTDDVICIYYFKFCFDILSKKKDCNSALANDVLN